MEDLLEEIGKELPPEDVRETYQTISKILGNILANPGEGKFRSLKKDNKLICKVLRSQHASSLLLALGFEDDGAMYLLPSDADLEIVRTVQDLIECMLLSYQEQDAPAAATSTSSVASGAPAVAGAATAAVAVEATRAARPAAENSSLAHLAALNPQGFKKRSDVESKRQEQVDQLQAARAAQRAQYAVNPQGPLPSPVVASANADAKAGGYPISASAATPAKKGSARDFESRGKKEQARDAAANNLEEMRKLQKDKFKEFQADPNAKQQEAYKAPPSVAAGAQEDNSWGGWLGGMFGGGSSSNQPSKPQNQDRRGPRIKGVADLPKPVQRGG